MPKPNFKITKFINFDLGSLTSDRTKEPELDKDSDSDSEYDSDSDSEYDSDSDDTFDWAEFLKGMEMDVEPSPATDKATHLPPPNLPSPSSPLSAVERKKAKRKRSQVRYRQAGRDKNHDRRKHEKFQKQIRQAATRINADISTHTLKKTKAAFIGINEGQSTDPLDDLEWLNIPRSDDPRAPSTVLVDKHGRIFAVRGTPSGKQLPEDFKEGLLAAMLELGKHRRTPSHNKHKKKKPLSYRGNYKTVTLGISYGTGAKKPSVLKDMKNAKAMLQYLTNPYVKHCTHQVKNFFQMWYPGLFKYYEENMSALEKNLGLKRLFPGLPFMASTLNLGPRTLTILHKDFKNLAFGQCAILVLGDFDHKNHGKLRLLEAGVELEVAPGDIVFIPSAAITHFNTGLASHETRYSLTFYTAGQLFRWVQNGHRPVGSLTKEEKVAMERNGEANWQDGWDKYLNINDM